MRIIFAYAADLWPECFCEGASQFAVSASDH